MVEDPGRKPESQAYIIFDKECKKIQYKNVVFSTIGAGKQSNTKFNWILISNFFKNPFKMDQK